MTELPIATDADDPPVDEDPQPTPLAIEFTGSAAVYFRIWIVNLCLTLLTLGVFSAWAKVRKKRYFYASIRIDDTPLQYLAEPLPILKGRIVATVLLIIWWFSSSFYLPALPWVIGAGIIIAPWIVASSAAFNSRYSAWRNLTFVFHGNYLGAAAALYWMGMIPLAVFTLVFDGFNLIGGQENLQERLLFQTLATLAIAILFPWWLNHLKRFVASKTAFGGHRVRYGARGGQFFGVYFVAGLFVFVGGIITGLLFFLIELASASTLMFVVLTLPVYLAYIFAFAYVRAKITNLVWNQAQLGPVGFHSSMHSADLFALYLTNALGILASFGLAIPWAVMRTMGYRIQCLEAKTEHDLSVFVGDDRSAVRAAAAETGDFFDLDLSL